MIRRPPRSTRPDTLCPDTTLFRSAADGDRVCRNDRLAPSSPERVMTPFGVFAPGASSVAGSVDSLFSFMVLLCGAVTAGIFAAIRSEERRVGKGCVRKCSSRGSPDPEKQKHKLT